MKIPIIATGISGLVGTRVKELLSSEYDFEDLSLATGVDITNYDDIEKRIKGTCAKVMIHMAAKTDVDGCEDDKILLKQGAAWRVNVEGTENIVRACKKNNIKVIYISTDFVFDGTKDFYTESDKPNPVNWYAVTKYEGEKIVLSSSKDNVVVRIAYPYRAKFPQKKDFVRRILEKIDREETILALTDHIITPTFIDDIARALKVIIEGDSSGIYHVVGASHHSVYDVVKIIAKVFDLKPKVKKVKRSEYFVDKAFRPFKLIMKNDRIEKFNIGMFSFEEGLQAVKKQINSN